MEELKERSMVKYIILHYLTLGLYDIYFYYRLSLDVDAACEGDGLEMPNYLVALALNGVTFGLYGLYWQYKLAQRMHVNAPRYGFSMLENGRDILVLKVVSQGLISAYELIKNMNRIAQVYNQGSSASEW
jgi:hypothetical protein